MEKGFGWWYPAGADGPDAPWNEQDHEKSCPQHEEWACEECIKADTPCDHASDMDCICADLAEDAKSDAADAKYEALRERKFNP